MPDSAYRVLDRLNRDKLTATDKLWLYPHRLFDAAGMSADDWQSKLLRSAGLRIALLCSRQVGKSTAAAALALKTALTEAPALVLIVSPSERQSGELMQKVRAFYDSLYRRSQQRPGRVQTLHETRSLDAIRDSAWLSIPAKLRESALQIHLQNGSRIIGLPGCEATVRGYSSVSLLIVDEAARVKDDLYSTVRPMLAVSRGRLLALTTPFGKRGWFHREWSEGGPEWERIAVRATECPRIPRDFLAGEERSLGARWYRQEYECSFEETVDQVFSQSDIDAALVDDVAPLAILGP